MRISTRWRSSGRRGVRGFWWILLRRTSPIRRRW
ncbi:hypothetical protein LINPERPRIM_LOCUS7986 [Linum perenne]